LSPIRVLGSALSLVNGAWALFLYFGVTPGANGGSLSGLVALVGGILVVDSLVSFLGMRISFLLGAILSVALLAAVALQWGAYASSDSTAAVVLSACAALADVVASRPARGLSEKDSPLNLPVFG
jgi:hypothetical protein